MDSELEVKAARARRAFVELGSRPRPPATNLLHPATTAPEVDLHPILQQIQDNLAKALDALGFDRDGNNAEPIPTGFRTTYSGIQEPAVRMAKHGIYVATYTQTGNDG